MWKYVNFIPIYFHSPKFLECHHGNDTAILCNNTHSFMHTHQVLQERLCGLTAALESTSVEKSQQQELVTRMTKDLRETQDFISVSPSAVE